MSSRRGRKRRSKWSAYGARFPETTASMTRKPKSLSDVMAQKPAAALAPTAVPASGETRIRFAVNPAGA